jgi:hypothetical protein
VPDCAAPDVIDSTLVLRPKWCRAFVSLDGPIIEDPAYGSRTAVPAA